MNAYGLIFLVKFGIMTQTQDDTILPFTQLMEDEFNRKLFKPSEVGKYSIDFDYSVLVQTDKTSEAEYYNIVLKDGIEFEFNNKELYELLGGK